MSDPYEEEFFCLFKKKRGSRKTGQSVSRSAGTRQTLLLLEIETDLSKKTARRSHPSLVG